ncbi:TonB-dependent receptor [Novosphingobium sp. BL-52-GroH]|uniref:TonB-dependent receptor n=1 Tax=Novosphingobium sp. BL-52-GroH TaxID=3349877 RepID=UPI00384E90AE
MSATTLSASLATGLMLLGAGKAEAQDAPPLAPADEPIRLGPVRVGADDEGEAGSNVLRHGTRLDRLPGDLQGTPQTVTVIPQVVIEQQQATTLDQVLKYVPGVTVATGEGGGGMNGDAFRIRGFDAKGDIYIDGLRDFGAYVRDDFATENVQVFKGSSSESFGNGTTGGAINLQSKTAHLGDSYALQGTIGNGAQARVVADLNKQLNATTALRIVGMWHDQDLVDRDHVYSKRWGVLGSLGLGLGTDQTLTISYMYQHGNRRPDMGVPIPIRSDGEAAYPVTEYGAPRSSFYGKETDRDITNVHIATVRYHKEIGDWLTITNDTRYAHYSRRMAFTPNICDDGGYSFYYNPYNVLGDRQYSCATDAIAGNFDTYYGVWPVYGVTQTSTGGQNITTAVARFDTAGLRHELVAGVDVYYQHNRFGRPSGNVLARDGGTLRDPAFENPDGFALTTGIGNRTRARSWDVGLFASDHIWFTDTVSLLAGLRWDSYHAKSAASDANGDYAAWTSSKTNFLSPKASLMWEPTRGQTYYVSYARSFTPQGANPTFQGTVSASEPNLDPDKNRTFEIGGKWSFLDDRLGASAALFRVIKNRGSYNDPTTGESINIRDKERVQGIELSLTGKVTPAWDVQASYTYMDSKILEFTPDGVFNAGDATGNRVPYVSKHGVALWSTYDIATLIPYLPGSLLVGGGVNYRSDYFADPSMVYHIPGATTFDALLSYEVDRYRLALNVTNLTNKLSYSSAFYFRAEVAPGRTVALTGSVKL